MPENRSDASQATRGSGRIALLTAMVVSALWGGINLFNGWYPNDEGQLGQAAERVLHGELPHRDFDEMYTGGLTFLHAAAFRGFGIRSEVLRWTLFVCWLPFLAACFLILKRRLSPWQAAAGTILCAAVSLPVRFGALPSWHNLFFGTTAVLCLFRFHDTGHRRWLAAGGLLIGTALLFKITALTFLAGALLILVRREQLMCDPSGPRSSAFRIFSLGSLTLFAMCSVALLIPGDRLMSALNLVVPTVGCAVVCGHSEVLYGRGRFSERFARLTGTLIPLLAGCALPPLLFAFYYYSQGALPDLIHGVFVAPRLRMTLAAHPFPPFAGFLGGIVPVTVLLPPVLLAHRFRPQGTVTQAVLLAVFAAVWFVPQGSAAVFMTLRSLGPWLAAAVLTVTALKDRSGQEEARKSSDVWTLTVLMVTASLVQCPFANSEYYFYFAPTIVLLAGVVATESRFAFRPAVPMLAVAVFFAVRITGPVSLGYAGPDPSGVKLESLGLERCSLVVEAEAARNYRRVISRICELTEPGEPILAGPDFPEAYFLSGRRNVTPVFYDFFRPDFQADTESLDRLVDRHNIRIVVLKLPPKLQFSELSSTFNEWVEQRFPRTEMIECADQDGQSGEAWFAVCRRRTGSVAAR